MLSISRPPTTTTSSAFTAAVIDAHSIDAEECKDEVEDVIVVEEDEVEGVIAAEEYEVVEEEEEMRRV
jgi:hypothetical protein